jgi:transposase
VDRIRSQAAFAMMAGTAPLIASSGMSSRHRLNRGGNRKLNFALHYMALVRYRSDEKTKAYVERRRAEGKTFKEAMRCLKRHLSNVVYRQMISDWKAMQSV